MFTMNLVPRLCRLRPHKLSRILRQRAYTTGLGNKNVKGLLARGPQSEDPESLSISGWVRSVRKHKYNDFLHINDGSCAESIQVVTNPGVLPDTVTFGSCVKLNGKLVKSKGQGQSVELNADTVTVLGECDTEEFPFKIKKIHPPDYVREFLHLRPRTEYFSNLLRVRNAATRAIHGFFQENDYCEVHTPILTTNDCEGAGEVFQVEPSSQEIMDKLSEEEGRGDLRHFFDLPTFLTVSGQLHLEVICGTMARVYNFSPTFRAEHGRTRHHLSEFSMVEAEIAFTENVSDLTLVIERLVKSVTQSVLDNVDPEIQWFLKNVSSKSQAAVLENIVSKPYRCMSYTEAVELLEKYNKRFRSKVEWGVDFGKEHEKFLVKHCDNVPVFVVDYPTSIKPFYMRENDDGRTSGAIDLLAPEVGEICGGSLREERYDILLNRLTSLGLAESMEWYLDIRKFGSAPHGGFGLGFERYIQLLLGISNIKDTLPFPRAPHYCKM